MTILEQLVDNIIKKIEEIEQNICENVLESYGNRMKTCQKTKKN